MYLLNFLLISIIYFSTFEQDKDYKDLKNCEIELGDRVKVKYGRGRLKKVYDAKVLKIQTDGSEKRYFVHYNGWNNRYCGLFIVLSDI